jgi:hypothetical protein
VRQSNAILWHRLASVVILEERQGNRVQIFAMRFWGFDPARWPIISFSVEANRDALIQASMPGDLIAFIGTQTEPTEPEDRGRFLGLAEIGRLPIDSLDVLDPANILPIHCDANGRLKWPKAIPMLRAWRFPHKPGVTDVLRKQLTYEATVRAVRLDEQDQAALLALTRQQVAVPDVEIVRRHRDLADALSASGPTRGPAPSSWSGTVTRDANAAATTYALRFGKRNVWKIGHAQDLTTRLADVNKHVPHEVLGERWSIAWEQIWPNETAAYEMEQRVFTILAARRTEGERVHCTEDELRVAWIGAMVPAHQTPGTGR